MKNYETKVIKAQVNLLWQLRIKYENDLTTNQIGWIDDEITYVEVKYLSAPNDSGRAEEYRKEKPEKIDFLEALDLLTSRIHNTISCIDVS